VPPFAKGLVRDLRVRWALEEAGLRYETRLLDQGEQQFPAYRALQPFAQVPASPSSCSAAKVSSTICTSYRRGSARLR